MTGDPSHSVRPFTSRVVRQEWADRAVTPMVDAQRDGEVGSREHVPAAAYDEAQRAVYVYRIRKDGTDHVGVVADVRLTAFDDRQVRGHEGVDPRRVDGLVALYADQPGRSEPVALLVDQTPAAADLVTRLSCGDPLLQFQGPDGLEHTLWRAAGEHADGLAAALAEGVQYIADGHHRVAARLRGWEDAGRPADAGVLCVLYPFDGLALSAFHRRVRGPVDADGLLAAAAMHFTVGDGPLDDEASGIGVYAAGGWHRLSPAADRSEGVAGLDVSLLHECLLGPALGITELKDPRLEVVPDHVALRSLTARCDDDGGALFVLRPPSLRALTRIADLGEEMPAKTTYFSPKPCSGIFLT